MAKVNVSIPKGTRDFTPTEVARRDYIFNTIRRIFQLHGFQAIETPAMENLSTLLGKYGEEGDKLLFRILNSGDFLKSVKAENPRDEPLETLAAMMCDRGLRYDLTVPFARYVAQHAHGISVPFKRYQIQPVWRADRPQKGRYREFYQCDVDIIGSNSLLNELELIAIVQEVFAALGLEVELLFNNRKLLTAIAEELGVADRIIDLTIAIDKQDKIGREGVSKELAEKGFQEEQIEKLWRIISATGSNEERLAHIAASLSSTPQAEEAIAEVRELLSLIGSAKISIPTTLDLSLARGLNYYTGAIFEVKARSWEIGSICGGGRYDNLTGIFGLKDMSGVGISFGADRIYDTLLALDKFPKSLEESCDLLILNLLEEALPTLLQFAAELRARNLRVSLYPDGAKFKKQLDYANKINVPWVAILGPNELVENSIAIKDMRSGEQQSVAIEKAADWVASRTE